MNLRCDSYRGWSLLLLGLLIMPALQPNPLWGQSPTAAEPVARVADFAIRAERLEAWLQKTVPGWPLEPQLQPPLRAAATRHLVNRQLVLLALHGRGVQATAAELEWKLDELRAQLERVGRTLDDHLATRKLTLAELGNELDWELSWSKYLQQFLTDDRLDKRFQSSPRDFDGTELHVAQLLLPAEPGENQPGGLPEAERLLRGLRTGELEWSAAVRRHSISPSRERDGDLGWIRRHEPMPEDFSRAAFALAEGEYSPPVSSRFGIHLIKCLQVRPGKRQFGDARDEVSRVVMEEEFQRLAEEFRPRVEVWLRPES